MPRQRLETRPRIFAVIACAAAIAAMASTQWAQHIQDDEKNASRELARVSAQVSTATAKRDAVQDSSEFERDEAKLERRRDQAELASTKLELSRRKSDERRIRSLLAQERVLRAQLAEAS